MKKYRFISEFFFLFQNWKIVRYKDYRIAIVSCLLLSDIISFLIYLFILKNFEVSWNSHFSASINGLLISGILFHSFKPWHCYRYFSLSVYMVLLTFSVIVYVPWLTNFVSQYSNYPQTMKNAKNSTENCIYHNVT